MLTTIVKSAHVINSDCKHVQSANNELKVAKQETDQQERVREAHRKKFQSLKNAHRELERQKEEMQSDYNVLKNGKCLKKWRTASLYANGNAVQPGAYQCLLLTTQYSGHSFQNVALAQDGLPQQERGRGHVIDFFIWMWLRYVRLLAIANPSVYRLLSSVTFVHPTQPVEIFRDVVRYLYPRHSLTSCKILRVAKYIDVGHVDGYMSETVQDTASGTIND